MKEFIIQREEAGLRVDRWLSRQVPLLPPPLAQKYLRRKRIKRNGGRTRGEERLVEGDQLQLYVNDEFFEHPTQENAFLALYRPQVTILYEDDHILLADKKPGMVVHPDEQERVSTLLTHIQAYLYQKGAWSPYGASTFAPALCNRIDRNTGGIVIAAKTAQGLRVMNQKIRNHELEKRYLCIIHGTMPAKAGQLEHILWKDEKKKQVFVHTKPLPGGKTAITQYQTLVSQGGLSLVECTLVTGRTHQIRAQFAAVGHPLLGDGKYGNQRRDRPYGRHGQALYAYRLAFRFTTDGGVLEGLNGRQWQVDQVDFVEEYFPGYCLPPWLS